MSDKNKKIPLIAVVGPTASGKTAAGVILAKEFDGEVVSADSMQIYKGVSIATAVPDEQEMQGVPHHLVSFADPSVSFSVADYVTLAKNTIEDISSRGKLPIVVGGTGLYINSLIDDISFDDTCGRSDIREKLESFAKTNGAHALWERLNDIDPEAAAEIHENNVIRVIRAIEVYELTGEKMSVMKVKSRGADKPYNCCMIGLTYRDRGKLYDRINERVDKMLENGLIDEAREFLKKENVNTAKQAIGIKELRPYFDGEEDLGSCIERIKQETRRYAKRQLTWFRKRTDINWICLDDINLLNFNASFTKILKTIVAKSDIL